jgi:hypothetical protein
MPLLARAGNLGDDSGARLAQTAPMSTPDDVRKIALALEGVTEIDHFARPAFRTKKRIFAVIRPDGLYLHLPPERKEFLFEADARTFVKYMWGKTPELLVQPKSVSRKDLGALLREAWESAQIPPKSVGKRVSSRASR